VGLGGDEPSPAQYRQIVETEGTGPTRALRWWIVCAPASTPSSVSSFAQRDDLVLERIRRAMGDPLRGSGPRGDRPRSLLLGTGRPACRPSSWRSRGPGPPPGSLRPSSTTASTTYRARSIADPRRRCPMLRHMCPLSGELRHSSAHQNRRSTPLSVLLWHSSVHGRGHRGSPHEGELPRSDSASALPETPRRIAGRQEG
jgi:hypothetical protein